MKCSLGISSFLEEISSLSHSIVPFYCLCMLGANLRQLCPTLCDPWAVAHQVPLSMGSSRQDYWSRVPCPPVGCLPDPEIRPMSLTSPALAGGFFTTVPPGKPQCRDKKLIHMVRDLYLRNVTNLGKFLISNCFVVCSLVKEIQTWVCGRTSEELNISSYLM